MHPNGRSPRRLWIAAFTLLVACDAGSIARAADGLWSQIPPPEFRLSAAAVYDRLHHRMILFGGNNGEIERNDVWVLELSYPNRWRRLLPTGTPPSVRRLHTAVYDPNQDRVILFGGGIYTSSWNANNEVWALQLSGQEQWVKINPAGTPPVARVASVAVFDALRNRMLLYGGAYPNGTLLGDMWALSFNGTPTWTQISPTTPIGPRAYAVAFLDSLRDRMVVMGGAQFSNQGYQSLSDTWTVILGTGTVWNQLATVGTPPTVYLHAGAYDPLHDQLVVFGGYDSYASQYRQGPWRLRFGLATPTWSFGPQSGSVPPAGGGQVMVYDPIADAMRIFGGWGGGASTVSQNTWTLWLHPSPNWGTPLAGTVPPSTGRYGASMAYDAIGHRMIVFGGASRWEPDPAQYLNDVWVLNLGVSPFWTPLAVTGTPPPARAQASMVYDPAGNRMVLYGGETDDAKFGDVWTLNLDGTPSWTQVTPAGTPPFARSRHGAIYDPARARMVMFGGLSLVDPYYQSDVWALSLTGVPTWTALTPTGRPPSRRQGMTVTLDPARDRMLMFGGISNTAPILGRDTWALNLGGATSWDSIAIVVGPVGRREHQSVYDPVRDRLLVFGGYGDNGSMSDLWSLSLAGAPAWSSLQPAGALDPLAEHSALYDADQDRLVSYGGKGAYNTTWLYLPAAVLDAPAPITRSSLRVVATPNPSGADVELSFALPAAGRARLTLFEVTGRRVATLIDASLPAGTHAARWDGRIGHRNAPAGVYLARLESGAQVVTTRVMRIR